VVFVLRTTISLAGGVFKKDLVGIPYYLLYSIYISVAPLPGEGNRTTYAFRPNHAVVIMPILYKNIKVRDPD